MTSPETADAGSILPLLELKNVSKSFGGVSALRDVDFALARGEIHGLVGENGAGKSTMMKIIAGMHHDFQGQMLLEGREVRFRNPHDSLAVGIGMVHQELSVVPDLDGCRECVPRQAADQVARHDRLGGHGESCAQANCQPRSRH